MAPQHWFLHIGDEKHFLASMPKQIWGIKSSYSHGKYFLRTAKQGDILWFVKKGSLLSAMAIFMETRKREVGPLIALTPTSEELGWTKGGDSWDTEVHYKELYDVSGLELHTGLKGTYVIRLFNKDKCDVNLPTEYDMIVRYSKVQKK